MTVRIIVNEFNSKLLNISLFSYFKNIGYWSLIASALHKLDVYMNSSLQSRPGTSGGFTRAHLKFLEPDQTFFGILKNAWSLRKGNVWLGACLLKQKIKFMCFEKPVADKFRYTTLMNLSSHTQVI